jgi:hypothetical protein
MHRAGLGITYVTLLLGFNLQGTPSKYGEVLLFYNGSNAER